jgi:hypothetical protein
MRESAFPVANEWNRARGRKNALLICQYEIWPSWPGGRRREKEAGAEAWARGAIMATLAPAEIQDSRHAAFETIDRALVATIRYMEGRGAAKPQDQSHEWQLTKLWMEASWALSPIDDPEAAKVADACMVKGLDWTDPETLYQARVLHYGLQLLVSALQQ